MSDYEDYDVDYDEVDTDPEPDEWTRKITHYVKRQNGVLGILEVMVSGAKYPGQDWGEADFWTDYETWKPLTELSAKWQKHTARIEQLGATLTDEEHAIEVNPRSWEEDAPNGAGRDETESKTEG